MNQGKIIVTFALQSEVVELPSIPGFEFITIITGVGKTLSAVSMMKAIIEHHPMAVINVGTAGTLHHHVGDIIVARRFVDRDLNLLPLPGIESNIVSNCPLPSPLNSLISEKLSQLGNSSVNTGDQFLTQADSVEGDAFDMEAFAQAVVCQQMNVPLVSVKYITDVVGQNCLQVWEDKLAEARKALTTFFLDLFSLNS